MNLFNLPAGVSVEEIIGGPTNEQLELIAKSPSLELIKHLRPDFSRATKSFPELLPHATFVVSDGSELTYAICMTEKIANDEGQNLWKFEGFLRNGRGIDYSRITRVGYFYPESQTGQLK